MEVGSILQGIWNTRWSKYNTIQVCGILGITQTTIGVGRTVQEVSEILQVYVEYHGCMWNTIVVSVSYWLVYESLWGYVGHNTRYMGQYMSLFCLQHRIEKGLYVCAETR